jgi:uncharacterized repeat protein (TIGR04061 family)
MSPLSAAPVRIDADLGDDLTNPMRLDAFPRESRAYVRIDISMRAYWHILFDAVPEFLELSGPDGRAIFLPFMKWARHSGLTFNWAYHIWVYEWLLQSEFKDRLRTDMLVKTLGAAAGRWLGRDRDPDSRGLVLGSALLDGKAVVGWKINTIHTSLIEVEQAEFDPPLPPPSGGHFGYFTTPEFELDHFPGWRPIPR